MQFNEKRNQGSNINNMSYKWYTEIDCKLMKKLNQDNASNKQKQESIEKEPSGTLKTMAP